MRSGREGQIDMTESNDPCVQADPATVESNSMGPLQVIDQLTPDGWRFKLAKAAAQLIAGSRRGAAAYGEMRERMDTIEGRSIVAKGMAEAVMQQSVNDPDLMERAKARFLSSTIAKQENLEAVIIGAAQPALALPAPQLTADTEGVPVDSDEQQKIEADLADASDEPLNADWASNFSNIAENASTDELRERLSRVLAGELSSPGTYSRATVRQIAELDKVDLEAMKLVVGYVVGDVIVRLSADGNDKPGVDMLLPLLESGLVVEASNALIKESNIAIKDGEKFHFCGRHWALEFKLNAGQKLEIPMSQLTRTGVAVVDLLGGNNERIILEKLVENLNSSYSDISIGRMADRNKIILPFEKIR